MHDMKICIYSFIYIILSFIALYLGLSLNKLIVTSIILLNRITYSCIVTISKTHDNSFYHEFLNEQGKTISSLLLLYLGD